MKETRFDSCTRWVGITAALVFCLGAVGAVYAADGDDAITPALPMFSKQAWTIGSTELPVTGDTIYRSETASGFASFAAGIYGEQMVLDNGVNPNPLEITRVEMIAQVGAGPNPTNQSITIEFYDRYTKRVGTGLTPYEDFLGGETFDLSGAAIGYAYRLNLVLTTPLGIGAAFPPQTDNEIFMVFHFELPTLARDTNWAPQFGAGPAQVGSSLDEVYRDQDRITGPASPGFNGIELDPGLEPDGGCRSNSGPPTCDRRKLVQINPNPTDWRIHIFGNPNPAAIDPGDDYFFTPAGCGYSFQEFLAGGTLGFGVFDFDTTTGGPCDDADFDGNPDHGSSLDVVGNVELGGVPLLNDGTIFPTDTILERTTLAFVPLPGPPGANTPVSLKGLSLASTAPITVNREDGHVETWSLEICLSDSGQPGATMNLQRNTCGDGGTFTSTLNVFPKLTLRRNAPDTACTIILDYGPNGVPVNYTMSGYFFEGDPSDLHPVKDNTAFAFVDGNCDGALDQLQGAPALLGSKEGFTLGARAACNDDGSCPGTRAIPAQFTMTGVFGPTTEDSVQTVVPAVQDFLDTDNDGTIDTISVPDGDGDGYPDYDDVCPALASCNQTDQDGDGAGDECDPTPTICGLGCAPGTDPDADSVCNPDDNCPNTANSGQEDADGDGVGDACDNCVNVANSDQADADSDGQGDLCDPCPNDPENDADGDGLCADVDDCDHSDPYSTVIIDGCNSGVGNHMFSSGCNFGDLIAECRAGASNHGQFVSCVAHLTNSWKEAGLITGRQKSRIQRCAAHLSPQATSFGIRSVGERP